MTSPIEPSLIDAIIAGVAVEALVLGVLLRKAGRSSLILPLWLFLASGALLMAAFRLAVSGAAFPMIGGILFGSFITHVALLGWAAQALIMRDARAKPVPPASAKIGRKDYG